MGYIRVACEGSLQARQVALVGGAPEKVLHRRVAGSLWRAHSGSSMD